MKSESEIMDKVRYLIYEDGPKVSKREQADMFSLISDDCEIEAEALEGDEDYV